MSFLWSPTRSLMLQLQNMHFSCKISKPLSENVCALYRHSENGPPKSKKFKNQPPNHAKSVAKKCRTEWLLCGVKLAADGMISGPDVRFLASLLSAFF